MADHADVQIDLMGDYKKIPYELDIAEGENQKATGKQRGYIKGLCKKLGLDPNKDLIIDVAEMTIKQASEKIEELKDAVDSGFTVDGYKTEVDFDRCWDWDNLSL